MNFDLTKISALRNTIDQINMTSENKGEEDFEIRLTHEDAMIIIKALFVLEKEIRDCENELVRLKNEAMIRDCYRFTQSF